jgi:hypothetical protein
LVARVGQPPALQAGETRPPHQEHGASTAPPARLHAEHSSRPQSPQITASNKAGRRSPNSKTPGAAATGFATKCCAHLLQDATSPGTRATTALKVSWRTWLRTRRSNSSTGIDQCSFRSSSSARMQPNCQTNGARRNHAFRVAAATAKNTSGGTTRIDMISPGRSGTGTALTSHVPGGA